MRASRIRNFDSARSAARRAMPKVLFDFIDGGADDEVTLRGNRLAFSRISLRPRQAMEVGEPTISTTVLGAEISMPLALAPCGGSRLVWPDGERALIRAAGAAGTAATLSTASGTSLEDEGATATGTIWFQLYFPGTREAAASLVHRAAAAGFSALFITVDMPMRGNQERVLSAQRLVPPRPTLSNAIRFAPQLALRPRWTAGYLRDGLPDGVSPRGPAERGERRPLPSRSGRPNVTWADIEWLRELWKGPLVVKGVLTGSDARRALECGADAIVVSNHGGRQLDTAPATIEALQEVEAEVGGRVELLLDGGVRRGTDVVKAIACGARAVLIGRPYLYGMAIAGEKGVRQVLEIFRTDISRTLKLMGRESVADLDRSCVGLDIFPRQAAREDERTWEGMRGF